MMTDYVEIAALRQPLNTAVIALSGGAGNADELARGLAQLRELGFVPHNYYDFARHQQRFADTDQGRLQQWQAALAHPQHQLVMALRGGYGVSRLLPELDFAAFAASGKVFVGHSDCTPIHQGLLAQGVCSIAGPMLTPDFARRPLSEFTLNQFLTCLQSQQHHIEFDSDVVHSGLDCAGTLWGGNLAMLCHTLGTPYWHAPEDGILFLEDIAEHPYRVERMLLQLHFAGVLARQRAIVLGDFSAYRLGDNDQGYDMPEVYRLLRRLLRIPVITGLPFGHIANKASLVVGSQANLCADGQRIRLQMNYQFNL